MIKSLTLFSLSSLILVHAQGVNPESPAALVADTLQANATGSAEANTTEEVETENATGAALKESVEESEKSKLEKSKFRADRGSIVNRPNARVMTLSVPGIRGPILDRNGKPLAVSKVSWYPALQFKQFEADATKEEIIEWGRERIAQANKVWGLKWNLKDRVIWEHYRFRRWMAMPYTFFVVTPKLKLETEDKLMDGLVLHPIYQRYYPNGKSAAHIIGYTGIKGKLEKGPINYGDPIFPYTHGKAGFEKLFNKQLEGRRGLNRIQYASDGTKFPEEVMQKPTIGGSVITTLNLDWQKHAERVLAQNCNRGAMVVIDVQTGEVLTMASRPSFDPNLFVPRALSRDFDPLRLDPAKPLYSRAFQGAYPPASAFKPLVALAGLHSQTITRYTKINCPAFYEFQNHKFWDWSKKSRGPLTVVEAIIRSNNPFFYKIGSLMGSSYFNDFARRFGYGQKTGLPLIGESSGNMPDNNWMKKHHRRSFHRGDDYNNAIGQGVLLATPLQVAQAMAAIANGQYLPKLQLVRQIQDSKGKVVAANKPDIMSQLRVDSVHMATVREGMMKVVNTTIGTGKKGALDFATVCGKTGTGQWKPVQDQYVAWFAGFFPFNEPKYAFAILYEGDPGEKVSGGKNAAPLVGKFFEPLQKEILAAISPPARAVIVVPESAKVETPAPVEEGEAPRAVAIDPVTGEPIIPRAVPEGANEGQTGQEEIPRALPADPQGSAQEEPPRAVPVQP